VVIAIGRARGLRATLIEVNVPMKPYGKRHRIEGDDGESYWFQAHAHLVATLRELCAIELDRGIVEVRIALGDATVHGDLAALRVVERDGVLELDAGGLAPSTATEIVAALGARASAVSSRTSISPHATSA
jgi:hypothetical protein